MRRGYDRCAISYAEARQHGSCQALIALETRLPVGSKVLDLGCGPGVPFTRRLAEKYEVTGVDISEEMIRLARRNVRNVTFIRSDMLSVKLGEGAFDAVVALYSVFHLPREEHEDLFRRIHGWLRRRGLLLVTVAAENGKGYVEDDFFGVSMYWSHFSQSEYEALLKTAGFRLVEVGLVGHGYGDAYQGPEERHPLILAEKSL